MSSDNKALVQSFIADFSDGKVDNAPNYFSPDFQYHDPAHPVTEKGYATYVKYVENYINAFDWENQMEQDIIACEDKVVVRLSARGKQIGYFGGLPPTNKTAVFEMITIYRLANGKIVEAWETVDMLQTLQQLGHLPQIGSFGLPVTTGTSR